MLAPRRCFLRFSGPVTVVLQSEELELDSHKSRNFCGLNCTRMVTLFPDIFRILAACSYVAHLRLTPLYCGEEVLSVIINNYNSTLNVIGQKTILDESI